MLSAKPRVRLSTGFIFQQTPCESVIPSEVAGQTAAEVVKKNQPRRAGRGRPIRSARIARRGRATPTFTGKRSGAI